MDTKNEITTFEEYDAEVERMKLHNHTLSIIYLYKRIKKHAILRVHIVYLCAVGISKLYTCYDYFLRRADISYLRLFLDLINIEEFFSIGFNYLTLESIVRKGVMDVLEFLVDNGLSVNFLTRDQGTMLMEAAFGRQRTVFDYLLSKGADVNIVSIYGTTVLGNIVHCCDVGFLDMAINHGIILHTMLPGQKKPVSVLAAEEGNHEIIERLVDMGVTFGDDDDCMRNFLEIQCVRGTLLECKPTLQLLRKGGAKEVDVKDVTRGAYTEAQVREVLNT